MEATRCPRGSRKENRSSTAGLYQNLLAWSGRRIEKMDDHAVSFSSSGGACWTARCSGCLATMADNLIEKST